MITDPIPKDLVLHRGQDTYMISKKKLMDLSLVRMARDPDRVNHLFHYILEHETSRDLPYNYTKKTFCMVDPNSIGEPYYILTPTILSSY